MGETRFTPGPWRAEGPDMFGDYNIVAQGLTLAVGAVVSNLRPAGEVAANACMAAAAPDLYEALKVAREYMRFSFGSQYEGPDAYVIVDAALALVSPQEVSSD